MAPNAPVLNNPGMDELIDPSTGKINPYATVKIINNGPDTLVWTYGGTPFEIPGTQDPLRQNFAVIPYELMVMHCGDPRSFDIPGDDRFRERTNQWARLRILYGVYDNYPAEANRLPNVEVRTITSDLPIITVLDDPEGTQVNETRQTKDAVSQLQDLIAKQQQQIEYMQAQLDGELKRRNQGPSNRQALTAQQLADLQTTNDPSVVPMTDEQEQEAIDATVDAEMEAAFATAQPDKDVLAAMGVGADGDEDDDPPADVPADTTPMAFG